MSYPYYKPLWEPLQDYKFSRLERYADLGIPDTGFFESKLYKSRRLSKKMRKILPELIERVEEGVSYTIRELDRKMGGVFKVGILKDIVDLEYAKQKFRGRWGKVSLQEYCQETFQNRIERNEINEEKAMERLTKLLTIYALTPLEEVHAVPVAFALKFAGPISLYAPMVEGLLAYFRDPDKDLYVNPTEAELSFLKLILLVPEEEKLYISREDFRNAAKMLLTYPLIRSKLSPIRIRDTWLTKIKFFTFMEEEIEVPDKDTISWDEFFHPPLNIKKAYLTFFNWVILPVSFGFLKTKLALKSDRLYGGL